MTADTWFLIAIISFALSAIALIVAIFIFIKLNIPSVIGDLSGKTVAREIRAMREANANAPGPAVPAYPGTRNKSSHTMRLPKRSAAYGGVPTGSFGKGTTGPFGKGKTGPVGKVPAAAATDVLGSAAATDVLSDAGATDVLGSAAATDVLGSAAATDVLSDAGATDVPERGVTAPLSGSPAAASPAVPFTVTRSMLFVHTTETI